MNDQTPEARLAAALAKVPYQHPRLGVSQLARSAPPRVVVTRDEHIAQSTLAADPTLAADLALAEKVRRLDTGQTNVTLTRWPNGKWTAITATVGSATGWGGPSDSLLAALEALRDD